VTERRSLRHLLIGLLCLAWMLPGLIGHEPWKPDEAYTFGVVHEILQGGSWIIPQLAGEPFVEKPPLFYLSAALSAQLFSPLLPPHDGARLVVALWIGLSLLFTALAAHELHGERKGLIAALLLLGSLGLIVRSHQLIADTAAFAGFAIASFGIALMPRRPWWGGFWLGGGIGVVFLSVGLFEAAMPAVVSALLVALHRHWRSTSSVSALGMAVLFALPWLLLWPVLLYQENPVLFGAWLAHELPRLPEAGGSVLSSLLHYLSILPWYAFPAWPVALWALWRAHRRGDLLAPGIVMPLAGLLVCLAMLALAGQARELYALPLLIPVALLATPGVDTLRRGAGNLWLWFSIMTFTFFIVVGWFYWSALELGLPAKLHSHLHTIRPGYDFGFRALPFLLGLGYTGAWFLLLVRLQRVVERPVVVWAAGLTAMWALLTTLFIGWIDTAKSYRSTVENMVRALPASYRCIAADEVGEAQRALVHYYAGIRLRRLATDPRAESCDLLLSQGAPLLERPLPPDWTLIWEGHRPGDKDERLRLYRLNAPRKS
jgi:4-amino-4-deoxy-L-arabinose transferase-like glycosyltransferase